MEQILHFPRLTGIKQYSQEYGQLGDDYIFSRLAPGNQLINLLNGPVRFSGIVVCMVIRGNISGQINLEPFTLCADSLMVLGVSSILKIESIDWSEIDAYVLIVSPQFLHDINLDMNALNIKQMLEHRPTPTGKLLPSESKIVSNLMNLMHLNATQNTEAVFSKNIGRSLVQAIIYQVLQFQANHLLSIENKVTQMDAPQSRKYGYVRDFMHLVQVHHTHERSISFYADKLFISPKYLSHIIKEATGRSAAEWIDGYVIQEAKNLLRFSNKNIQQVAYALNFSTQSSFGKYFKHITGMSPTEYQKT